MRSRIIIGIGALLLASAGVAGAQQPTTSDSFTPRALKVDFGFRATDVTGDAARFQRFRDWRDGAYVGRFSFERERSDWAFAAGAYNVGYRDQRFAAQFQRFAKIKASFLWDQVPLFFSEDTRSLFSHQGNGDLTVSPDVRSAIAAGRTTLAAAQVGLSAFDTRNRRDTGAFNLVYSASRELDVTFDLKSARREGTMPFSGTLGTPGGRTFELPAPIDTRTTDVTLKVEWANRRGLVSAGYTGSWFDNNIPTITWDNPFSLQDAVSAPTRGRLAMFPGNTAHTVSTSGSLRLPGRSRATAYVSIGAWDQNEPLLAPTTNTALVSPVLERQTAEAEARIVTMNYTFASRPTKYLGVNARYRFYDYDNRTPQFSTTSMVVSDLSLGAAQESEPPSYKRQNVDVDVTIEPVDVVAFKVGYGRRANDYSGKVRTEGGGSADSVFRIFKTVDEDVFRVSGDSLGNQYVSFRAQYEFTRRRGTGFEEYGEAMLEHATEHVELRHFDVADRDRRRGTFLVQITPVEAFGVSGSFAVGTDDYTVDPHSLFGLRDNTHNVYTVGFDVVPSSQATFNLTYGYERYTAYQYSRTANPLATDTGVIKQFLDPRRDWSMDTTDKVHTLSASLGLDRLVPRTEMRFGYDLSRAKAAYVFGLAPDTVLAAPAGLPAVTNELQSATADVRYFVRRDVAIGLLYWYDRYLVDDFGQRAIVEGIETGRLDLPLTGTQSLYLGYASRPYTANSLAVRLTYLW